MVLLVKTAIVASLTLYISNLSGGKLNYLLVALILGVLFRKIGFLEEDVL